MKLHTRKAAAGLLAAILCCSALCLAGCGESSSSQAENSIYSPVVPDSRIDESVPGDLLEASLAETCQYQDKLTVTLEKVVELDSAANDKERVLCAELTIVNNSQQPVDCSTLTHFSTILDGEEDPSPARSVSAAVAARRYYTAIGSDLMAVNQAIEPGETLSGYVYLSVPKTWEELKLVYIPYKYYSNDRIVFEITESGLTHYSEKV